MSQTQEHSREILQQAIDARIKALEESFMESVRVLRLERNALAPISSLPPEVLTTIFSLLCSSGKPSNNLQRIRLSHVCHQWREIAINQPLLWNHVDFTTLSSAGAAGTLARAKSAPLYLEARMSRNDVRFSTFRQEVQAHLPRICHLGVSAECDDIHSTLGALGSPAPTLESVSLFSTTEFYRAKASILDTLFDRSAPRLSWLKLRHCGLSWKWPALKGLKYLEILKPARKKPKLADWLDALAEMPDLKTLILNEATPNAPPFPFDVERIVTLPSLARFTIEGFLEDCVFALAHLDLPAVTQLSLDAFCTQLPGSSDVQELLPYIARYVYGTQHPQPLQSMLIRNNRKCIDILIWPVPDIGIEVQNLNPPILLGATLPTRLALSLRSYGISDTRNYSHLELLEWLMTGLPLDGIATLAAQNLCGRILYERNLAKQFWLHISPKFPQLRRVRLSCPTVGGFIEMLLEDSARPLLPSLTELVVVDASVYDLSSHPLCDALMKRVEQGVPLEVLDLRMCFREYKWDAQLRELGEIVADVLGPESYEASNHMRSLWKPVPLGIFLDDNDRADTESYTGSDNEEESDEE